MDEQTTQDVIERIIASYGNDPDQWPRELYPLALGQPISADVLERLLAAPSAPSQTTGRGNACTHGQKVRVQGLVNAAQHNGKIGYVRKGLTQQAAEGRIGVKCEDGTVLSLKRKNIELLESPPPPPPPPPPLPPRTGGAWDDVTEQQAILALTEPERAILAGGASTAANSRGTALRAALSDGVNSGLLKLYANAPRYDRLFVCTTTKDKATYVLEAGLDAWDGSCCWTTKDLTEANLRAQGLVALSVDGLHAEYGGVLTFFDTCKRLGAPRYTIRTDLDPNAKPHVIAVVERLLAASSLRFLLDDAALARVDGVDVS